MIYTANNTTGVRYKVVQNIRGAVAFELTDKGDYPAIVGRLDGRKLPKIMGRAFRKGNPPVEFQAAVCMEGRDEQARSEALKKQCARMREVWQGFRPAASPAMPQELRLIDIFEQYKKRAARPPGMP